MSLFAIVGFLESTLGRLVVGAGVIGAAVLTWTVWLSHHDDKVTAKLVTSLNAAVEELSNEAVDARAPALRPGAFARLRANACGNCPPNMPRR